MAHDQHLADFPSCTNIPHAIFNAQVVYCPHDQGWICSVQLGDDQEAIWSRRVIRYGPFDDITNVAYDLAQYLRVIGRRALIEGALIEHRGADWWASVNRSHGSNPKN